MEIQLSGGHASCVEGDAVADRDPDDGHRSGKSETLHQDGQDVFYPNETAVEKGETRDCHKQNEGRCGEHPGCVPGVQVVGKSLTRTDCQGKQSKKREAKKLHC